MTFYNVLFSLIFLFSFSIALGALNSSDYPLLIQAAIILLLVINHIIYSRKENEEDNRIYRTSMNLIDLMKIVTLCLLMVALPGESTGIFQSDLVKIKSVFHAEVWFWLFVFIYWLLDNAWRLISVILTSTYTEPAELVHSRWVNLSLFVLVFLLFLLSIKPDVLMVLRVTVLVWLFIYVFIIKFLIFIKPDAKSTGVEEAR